MMRNRVNSILSVCLLTLVGAGVFSAHRAAASDATATTRTPPVTGRAIVEVVEKYGEVPGGVVLEGRGGDFGEISKVTYDREQNAFRINDEFTYQNPVSREQMRDILEAIRKDDRIGVSLSGPDDNQRVNIYGSLSGKSSMIKSLQACDNLLGDIVLALPGSKKVKIEGGYVPKVPKNKTREYAAFFAFADYRFQKDAGVIKLKRSMIDITLVPLRAGSGDRNIPDYDALEKGQIPEEYKANADHVRRNEEAYKKRKAVQDVVLFGEAAAFARALKTNKGSLSDLASQLK